MGVITRGIAQNILSNGRLDATDGLVGLIPNTNLSPIYFVDDSSTASSIQTNENFKIAGGTNITTSISGDTLTINFNGSIPVSGTDFDPVGTDNSTNVTLDTSSYDYLSLSGQEITLNQIDATTDISNLSSIDVSTFINDIGYITQADIFSISIADDSSNVNTVDSGDTIRILGGTNISTELSGDTLTITNDFTQDFRYASLTGAPTDLSDFNNDVGYVTAGDIGVYALNVADDSSTEIIITNTETLTIRGGTDISTSIGGGNTIDINFTGTIPQSGTDFDPVGTDNSTDVTLVTTSYDYLSLSGQEITLNQIDATTDISNLSSLNVSTFINDAGYITSADTFSLTIADDSSNINVVDPGDTIKIAGGTNISTEISGDTITITNDFTQDFAYSSLTGVPTNVSSFNNDAGYITSADIFTISFADDTSTVVTPDSGSTIRIIGGTNISTAFNGDTITITNDFTQDFAYSSLTGAPTNVSTFNNDAGYITDADVDIYSFFVSDDSSTTTEINRLETLNIAGGTNISTSLSGDTITITNDFTQDFAYSSLTGAPTNVSSFNNDVGYITNADIFTLFVGDDASTVREIGTGETIRFIGGTNISTTVDTEGNITITNDFTQDFAYSSLTGAPTNVSSFNNDAGYITSADIFSISFVDDSSTVLTPDSGESIKIAGGTNISTSISGDTITITNDFTQDFAYSSLTGAPTNVSQFNNDAGYITSADTFSLNISDDASNVNVIDSGDTIKIAGGTDISTSLSGDTLTINFDGSIPVSGTDFDPVGTDNSTDVTLDTTSYDYLSLSGQEITLNQIDATTDISNLNSINVSTFINDAGYLTTGNFMFSLVDDTSTSTGISVGETLQVLGGTNITTTISGDTLTIDFDGTIPTNNNELINGAGYITNSSFNIIDDSSTTATIDTDDTLHILGGDGIATVITGSNSIQISADVIDGGTY